jgi:release factor glutamine methyltransferase
VQGSNADDEHLTWRRLWSETADLLGDANEARWLCQEAGGFDSIEWATSLDDPVTERAVARVDSMTARRRSGEPLQYVLGSWAFRTVELMVDRRVLIPRPETELLAGHAIEHAKERSPRRVVVDLGTGSGAIALACAAELSIEGTTVWGTDVSEEALAVARANAAGLGRAAANVRLAAGPWFEALPPDLRGEIDVVVSNPPYIAEGDDEVAAEVLEWEPRGALFSGHDGLADIRHLIDHARSWLRPGGVLLLEIGYRQGDEVRRLLADAGYGDIEIRQDLAGRDRIAYARR